MSKNNLNHNGCAHPANPQLQHEPNQGQKHKARNAVEEVQAR